MRRRTARIVAVIGDGSLTGGMAFEGLNNLGHSGKKAILILNDNGRSYAPTVSKLGESLARLRAEPDLPAATGPASTACSTSVPVVGHQLERSLDGFVAAVREMFEPPAFFETLGVRYTGPFDGHDIEGLEKALRHAAEYDGPIVVHVLTQKGRGYAPAENDPIKRLHDIGARPKPGSYTAAFTEAMIKEAEERPELVAITAAMPDSTGLLPFGERFPGRLIDVGIAEQHAVTSAAGMAMGGLRPVVAVYSTFLTRAIDQVTYDVGLHGQPVVFCLDRAGITGDDGAVAPRRARHGAAHQGAGHDGVRAVVLPGARRDAPRRPRPVHRARRRSAGRRRRAPSVGPTTRSAPACAARKVRAGPRPLHPRRRQDARRRPREAAEALAAEGIEATVWDVRVVPARPRDARRRRRAPARDHRRGRHPRRRRRLAASPTRIAQLDRRPTPPQVRVLGTPIAYIPHGKPDDILADLGLDAAGLAAEARASSPPSPSPDLNWQLRQPAGRGIDFAPMQLHVADSCIVVVSSRRGSRRRRGRWCR